LPEPLVLNPSIRTYGLHEVPEFHLQSRFVVELLAILGDNVGTASQTARWISGSTTRFKVASNISREVDAELEIGVIQFSVLSLSLKQAQKDRQFQQKQ